MMRQGGDSRAQFVRFVAVGIASNVVVYLLYILSTSLGAGHKTAMTVLYMLGVLQTFVVNRAWSFGHDGPKRSAFVRYLVSYLFAYLLNLGVMHVMVDIAGYSDRWVQGCMVIIVATLMFCLQKFWVFQVNREPVKREPV